MLRFEALSGFGRKCQKAARSVAKIGVIWFFLGKFVAQWDSTSAKAIQETNVGSEESSTELDTLNFWGGGALYIFIEPESKVVCMLIQKTYA